MRYIINTPHSCTATQPVKWKAVYHFATAEYAGNSSIPPRKFKRTGKLSSGSQKWVKLVQRNQFTVIVNTYFKTYLHLCAN